MTTQANEQEVQPKVLTLAIFNEKVQNARTNCKFLTIKDGKLERTSANASLSEKSWKTVTNKGKAYHVGYRICGLPESLKTFLLSLENSNIDVDSAMKELVTSENYTQGIYKDFFDAECEARRKIKEAKKASEVLYSPEELKLIAKKIKETSKDQHLNQKHLSKEDASHIISKTPKTINKSVPKQPVTLESLLASRNNEDYFDISNFTLDKSSSKFGLKKVSASSVPNKNGYKSEYYRVLTSNYNSFERYLAAVEGENSLPKYRSYLLDCETYFRTQSVASPNVTTANVTSPPPVTKPRASKKQVEVAPVLDVAAVQAPASQVQTKKSLVKPSAVLQTVGSPPSIPTTVSKGRRTARAVNAQ